MCPGRPPALSSTAAARFLQFRPVSQQGHRVEVPLDGDAGSETSPGFAQIDAPIDPDHVGSGLRHEFEYPVGAGGEIDDRDSRFARPPG